MKYNNLPQLFYTKANRYGNKNFIEYLVNKDEFVKLSWLEVENLVKRLAAGLLRLNVNEKDHVGILAQTSHNWFISDFAIMSLGAVTVPIYHNSAESNIQYISEHADLKCIIVQNKKHLEKIRSIFDKLPKLQYVIVIDDKGDIPKNEPKIITFDEVLNIGTEDLQQAETQISKAVSNITPDHTATIIYTSGTTGNPKGVELTHRNCLVAALSFFQYAPFSDEDRMLSFLPLAHVFERIGGEFYSIDQGMEIVYCDRIDRLPFLLKHGRCTVILCVPRILEKSYSKMKLAIGKLENWQQKIFEKALSFAVKYHEKKLSKEKVSFAEDIQYNLIRSTVFKKIRDEFSPTLKTIVTGGSALNREIAMFYMAIGYNLIEGYGLTETAPISVNPIFNNHLGTVGLPFSHFEVKLSADSELLCRGPSVFKGYYKDPDSTKEAFDDTWFKTGDLGSFDSAGYLSIVGRKKDIIVASSGKNISPVKVESVLQECKFINQAVVFGDNQKYLSSLITLDVNELESYIQDNNLDIEKPYHESKEIRKLITEDLKHINKQLDEHERVKKFTILAKEFTIENNEITPTLKYKRYNISKIYENEIQAMFNSDMSFQV
jgi:long-chain acyl-CoA synthetase